MTITKIKKIFHRVLLGIALISLLTVINLPVTEAKYSPVSRNICSLAVAPYNPEVEAATELDADKYLNYLDKETCNKFVELFGKAYSPQSPTKENNPLKPGSEDKNIPIIRHDHSYFNDTIEDENFFYKAFVDRFEITLQSDGFSSIDMENIKCQTPLPFGYDKSKLDVLEDCSGTLDDLWGGTKLTKTTVGNKLVIRWDFASTNKDGNFLGRPQVWANNGVAFDKGNFTDENDRKLEFNVHLPTKNNNDVWSATTSSRVLLADQAINKNNYESFSSTGCNKNDVNDAESGWCYITPDSKYQTETVFTTENKAFYWFDIGSVATVWQKINPPESPNACRSLKASLGRNNITINDRTAYPINIDEVNFFPINEIPAEAEYKYTSDDPHGEFWILSPLAGIEETPPYVKIGSWQVTTYKKQVFYKGQKTANISIELVGIPSELIGNKCNDKVSILIEPDEPEQPEIPECKELQVNHPEKIYKNTVSIFKAKALNTENAGFPGKIKYWVEPGYGEFYTIKPNSLPENNAIMVNEISSATYIPIPDKELKPLINFSLDPDVFIAGNDEEGAAKAAISIITELATGDLGIEDLSKNIKDIGKLEKLNRAGKIELPDWLILSDDPNPDLVNLTGEKLDTSTSDTLPEKPTGPAKFGLNNVLLALSIIDEPGEFTKVIKTPVDNYPELPKINILFESITVDPETTVYFWAKKAGNQVIHIKTVDSEVPECSRDFDILELPEPQQICEKLNLISDPAGPLTIGQPAVLSIYPTDKNNKSLSPATGIKISSTAGGKFTTSTGLQKIIELKGQAVSSQFPILFSNSDKAGKVTIELDPADPAYAAVCKGELEIKAPPSPEQACLNLKNFDLHELGSPNQTVQLEKEKLYSLKSGLETKLPVANNISYTINPLYGAFIDPSKIPAGIDIFAATSPVQMLISNLKTSHMLTPQNLTGLTLTYQTTVAENTAVLLITFSNPPSTPTGTMLNILTIQGTGYSNAECKKYFPFFVPEQPPIPGLCENIELQPAFNPNSGTFYNLTGNYQNHNGDIRIILSSNTTPDDKKAYINRIDQPTTKLQEITFYNTELKTSTIKAFEYHPNGYNENTDTLTLTVEAVNSSDPDCKKIFYYPPKTPPPPTKQCLDLDIIEPDSPWNVDLNEKQDDREESFQISVNTSPSSFKDELYYNWDVRDNDGEWQNSDDEISKKGDFTQTLEDFEPGTEIKVWASTTEFGPTLNYCEDFITAKGEGEKNKPEIEKLVYPEDKRNKADDIINITGDTDFVTYVIKFETGNDITRAEIWDSRLKNGTIKNSNNKTTGYLNLENIKIIFIKNNNKKDDGTIIFDSNNFSKKNYEDNACDNSNHSVCIEIEKKSPNEKEFVDYIQKTFSRGEKLIFKNLEYKNSELESIRIEYEMRYIDPINDEKCQKLLFTCGEQFKNEANFTADSKSTPNKDYKGDSDTKVIAICPYILTRQGGSSFFHDVIDTGIDVAQCSEVKSCDGPCITPEPPVNPEAPKTGTGTGTIADEFIKLGLPSHDVCRYSNIGTDKGNTLEGYNNVLKNFSSTICELRADVSKAWTEKNINDSIAANVKRLARWDGNLKNISEISTNSNLPDSKNGVFVKKDGPLTIDNGNFAYTIKKTSTIPAAQTYIVIGGNLQINSDIKYQVTDFNEYINGKNIPSAAFIVINGNINIAANVKQIDGILMAVDTDDSGDGKVTSGLTKENTLTINGNLFGDVYDLFKNRRAVGDPRKEEGSVTIRYDERILLNPPPGINELINIQQAIVPN